MNTSLKSEHTYKYDLCVVYMYVCMNTPPKSEHTYNYDLCDVCTNILPVTVASCLSSSAPKLILLSVIAHQYLPSHQYNEQQLHIPENKI